MRDQTDFHADAADIRSLLDGTDPAADLPTVTTTARLADLRDKILSADAAGARQRTRPWRATDWTPRRPLGRRRSRTVVAYTLIPTLLAVTGAAWALTSSHQPGLMLECFTNASLLHSHGILVSEVNQGQSPVAFCAHEWSIGAVTGDPHSHHVPPLVACEISNGIGVFPHATCARLHLRPLSAGYLSASRNLAAFTSVIQRRLPFGNHGCVHERQAVPIARQTMNRYGYVSWHLRIDSTFWMTGATLSPATSCVNGAVNPQRHVVELQLSPGPTTAFGRLSAAMAHVPGGKTCTPGSLPYDTKALFTPSMRRLFARALPGWTLRVAGPRTDRAHPCYGYSISARTKQWVLFTVVPSRPEGPAPARVPAGTG